MSSPRLQRLRDRWADPLLTVLTITVALVMFVVAPLQATGLLTAHNSGFGFAVIIVATAFIVSGSWIATSSLAIALALIVVATVLRVRHPSNLDILLDCAAWLILAITLSTVTARAAFAPGRITYHRVIGAVLLYLMIGLGFAPLYCVLMLISPDTFSGLKPIEDNLSVASNFLYFSFVTLTTVGYGDVTPVHPIARSLANIEAIIGQLYPATLLARLVTLQTEDSKKT